MSAVLLTGGHIYSSQDPFATAMLVADGVIVWVGDDSGALIYSDDADQCVDLRGALVTPGFVDSHVHLTSFGLTLDGLDLSEARSLGDCLERIEAAAGSSTGVLLGHGWDESTWPEGRVPTCAEIDARVGDRPVYLTRVDVHSALASTALRSRAPHARALDGWSDSGAVARAAHHALREVALASVTPQQRASAQGTALGRAAAYGVVSVHENAGPTISGADDLQEVLALGRDPYMPEVVGYWGALDAHEEARELGARGAAGDLFADGSLGSHTACLLGHYADEPGSSGAAYLTSDEIAAHIIGASNAGMQAGFHVIGDGATHTVVDGLLMAEKAVGRDAIRRGRHRLEHVEMPTRDNWRVLADLGVVASVQPAFDAAWGGPTGMYARRLGGARAARMNPFAGMIGDGVLLAFGSDAPVTAIDPWGTVRAAARHTNADHAISVRAAFAAHTRGGRRAAHDEAGQPGVLAVGAPASYAVWAPGPLAVQAPDGRVSAWSTDPRSGVPPLPDLDAQSPTCWRTVRDGRVIFDSGDLS